MKDERSSARRADRRRRTKKHNAKSRRRPIKKSDRGKAWAREEAYG